MMDESPKAKAETRKPPSPEELSAYHDGEAPPELRRAIETWLADQPEAAKTLADWRSLDAGLRAQLDPVVDEAVPGALTAPLARRLRLPYPQAAAAAVLLVVAVSSGWIARGVLDPAGFPEEALRAHAVYAVEQRHPVEVDASQSAHLKRWLSKRTGVEVMVPSLEGHGYALMGGRLLSSSAGPAALLMYEDGQANRVSLIVARHGDKKSKEVVTLRNDQGTGLFWWDREALYAVVGKADESLLRQLGASVTEQKGRI